MVDVNVVESPADASIFFMEIGMQQYTNQAHYF